MRNANPSLVKPLDRASIVQSKSNGDTIVFSGNMAFSTGPKVIGEGNPYDAGYILCLSNALKNVQAQK